MKEIAGELWDYHGKPNHVVCITTNGTLKKDGSLVMGRGCAKEAKDRDLSLPKILGDVVKRKGNIPTLIAPTNIMSFPVKHNYWEQADLALIAYSAGQLHVMAERHPELTFILPRPGCGNGRRSWDEVKPLLAHLPDNVLVISRSQ